jgi:hypothetical protein
MQVPQVFPQVFPIASLLTRRALVPVLNVLLGDLRTIFDDGTPLPNLNNVQGDAIFMFPKVCLLFTFYLQASCS